MAVESKCGVVLNSSVDPFAAATWVRDSRAEIWLAVKGWNVRAAESACSKISMRSMPQTTTETGMVME